MNHQKNRQTYGIGLESEGFIVRRGTLTGIPRIEGKSSYEWIEDRVRSTCPQLLDRLSPEQVSVMLEFKTEAYADDGSKAIAELRETHARVNDVLASVDAEIAMVPVLPEPFEFIPASSDPNSRSAQLVREWGSTPEGIELLYSTAIASLQINHSGPFRGMAGYGDGLEIGRRLHNAASENFQNLDALNDSKNRDFRGLTRMENLRHLLVAVKKDGYEGRGYSEGEILVPPQFLTVTEMRRWMAGQSAVANIEDARCKNEHALTMKLKRPDTPESAGIWAAESRTFDAVPDEKSMIRLIRAFDRVCSSVESVLSE